MKHNLDFFHDDLEQETVFPGFSLTSSREGIHPLENEHAYKTT